MDVIANLKSLTIQIDDKKTLLNKLTNQRPQLDKNLEDSLVGALDNLKRQISDALVTEMLPELDLTLSAEKIKELISAGEKKKELQAQIEDISNTISSLLRQRCDVLKAKHEVLEDFGEEFWRNSLHYNSEYKFESDILEITFHEKTFIVPYLRFTQPEKEVTERIKPLIEKRDAQDKLKKINAEKAAIEAEIEGLDAKILERQLNSYTSRRKA